MLTRILLLATAGLLLTTGTARAQDLLTRRNGDEVKVKVLEITPTEVRYRRFDNPDGPLISVWKTDVFMIRYANGTSEIVTPLPAGAMAPPPRAVPPPAPPYNPTTSIFDPQARTAVVPPAAPAAQATAVSVAEEPILGPTVQLSGPRLGFTVLAGQGLLNKVREELSDNSFNPFVTQFGWQFETQLFRMPNGVSGLLEIVPLVGGLEQGHFIPSLSGLLGIRGPKGFEVGLGPNVTPVSANVVLAVGASFKSNGIHFPVNLAVVPGNGGARVSLLVGFNARRR